MEAKFEEKLGMLVFSSADPALDIARDLEFFEGDFKTWLVQKADDSNDLQVSQPVARAWSCKGMESVTWFQHVHRNARLCARSVK